MITKLLTAYLVVSALLANAALSQEPVDAAINAKIRDEGLNRSQVLKTFEHFTEAIGPRLTGSPAAQVADDYAVAMLKQWGIANAHLEPWEFGRGWQLEKSTIELAEPRYTPLIGYPEAWSASTPNSWSEWRTTGTSSISPMSASAATFATTLSLQ